MTDATTPAQPRTAAGRDFCGCDILQHSHVGHSPDCAVIAAIEVEAQARPAVASEGLRAALLALLAFAETVANTSNDPHLVHEAEALIGKEKTHGTT